MTTNVAMPYVRLGKSGLKVSRIILGCMSYGSPDWQSWVLPEAEGKKHIKAAYDLGINAFDTANGYSNGQSEVVLGKAIKEYNLPRDEIVVMTKVYGVVQKPDEPRISSLEQARSLGYINRGGLSRKSIFDSVKASLARLQLDYIDLLQCHRFDPSTPIEETMVALHDLVKQGLVRYIGMSSCYAWQFAKMQNYAMTHNLTPFISMQNFFNAAYREEEREMIPLCQDLGVGIIPWSPLARGFLARPHREQTVRSQDDKWVAGLSSGDAGRLINEKVETIAKAHSVSMAQVALAWSLSKSFITAPIVGTTSLDKLADLAGGIHLQLSEEEIKSIDDLYKPRAVFGH